MLLCILVLETEERGQEVKLSLFICYNAHPDEELEPSAHIDHYMQYQLQFTI